MAGVLQHPFLPGGPRTPAPPRPPRALLRQVRPRLHPLGGAQCTFRNAGVCSPAPCEAPAGLWKAICQFFFSFSKLPFNFLVIPVLSERPPLGFGVCGWIGRLLRLVPKKKKTPSLPTTGEGHSNYLQRRGAWFFYLVPFSFFFLRKLFNFFNLFLVGFCTTKFQLLNLLPCPGLWTQHWPRSAVSPGPRAPLAWSPSPHCGLPGLSFVTVLCWGLAPRWR